MLVSDINSNTISTIKVTEIGNGIFAAQADESISPKVPYLSIRQIKKIIINEPATIIMWKDGTKTVVKLKEGDLFDPEKGIMLCILKKMFGNSSTRMGKWLDEQTKEYYDNFYADFGTLESVVDAMQKITDKAHDLIYGKSEVSSNVETTDTK